MQVDIKNKYVNIGGFRGTHPACVPLWPEIFSISCSFLKKIDKFVCWCPPPPDGWRLLLWGILAPPLVKKGVNTGLKMGKKIKANISLSCNKKFKKHFKLGP